jgi:hypothetical protein
MNMIALIFYPNLDFSMPGGCGKGVENPFEGIEGLKCFTLTLVVFGSGSTVFKTIKKNLEGWKLKLILRRTQIYIP